MTSKQYEELCRYFIADKRGISTDQVKTVHIPNPTRPGLPEYRHQIDLYWEIEDDLTLNLYIANAKWRSFANVDQPDVLLLQQVKQNVAAHKAVMITNSDFTSGARAVAQDFGIALHIVRPNFDYVQLNKNNPAAIQTSIQEISTISGKPLYNSEVVHKAFDFGKEHAPGHARMPATKIVAPVQVARSAPGNATKILRGFSARSDGGSIRSGGSSNKGSGGGRNSKSGGSRGLK